MNDEAAQALTSTIHTLAVTVEGLGTQFYLLRLDIQRLRKNIQEINAFRLTVEELSEEATVLRSSVEDLQDYLIKEEELASIIDDKMEAIESHLKEQQSDVILTSEGGLE